VRKLLITAIAKINEEKTLYLVRQALEKGIEPFTILEDVRRGLEIVVEMYNQGKYFLADLVMAAEIYKEAQKHSKSSLDLLKKGILRAPSRLFSGQLKKTYMISEKILPLSPCVSMV